jgi:predicted GIY-YIG superfamily endonuclease
MWVCYLLTNRTNTKTYVGITQEHTLDRRLRQHNGELTGGAKYTRGDSWTRVGHVTGFTEKQAVLQFEWKWKSLSRVKKGTKVGVIEKRFIALFRLTSLPQWTSKATPYIEYIEPLRLVIESPLVSTILNTNSYFSENYHGQFLL